MRKAILYPILGLIPLFCLGQTEIFTYKEVLLNSRTRTLNVRIQSINKTTGEVEFGGVDTRGPTTPGLTFTWIWGDGTSTTGFFPQKKTYADVSKNYLAKVVSNYSATEKDSVELLVNFVEGKITPVALDPRFKVYIPDQPFAVDGVIRTPFPNRIFDPESRAQLEYLLQVCSEIEYDFVNGNVRLTNGKFEQYMFRDSLFPGAYALAASVPIAFGAGDVLTRGNVDYSSMCHEMGHNYTLNTPASFNVNGKLGDRPFSFYGEAIAQIFQQAAGYELLNNYRKYGIDEALQVKLKNNFLVNARFQRASYLEYVKLGMPFSTWSRVPGYSYTDSKEAFLTFIVVAYKFMEMATQQEKGFRTPMKRLMQFLQRFDSEWVKRYDGQNDTPAANAFRATLWAAAMSHAFQRDLRTDFKAINFPISDTDWAFLHPQILSVSTPTLAIGAAANSTATFDINSNVNWTIGSSESWLVGDVSNGNNSKIITLTAAANPGLAPRTATITVAASGLESKIISVIQAGTAPTLSVSSSTLAINASGSDKPTVNLVSNTTWTARSSQTWLTVTPNSGTGSQTLSVTATANDSAKPRTATLTFSASGIEDKTVNVTQAGAAPTLTVSTNSLDLAFAEGSSATFDIASNTEWTASSSASWLTVAPGSGLGNSKLMATATANSLFAERQATITLRAAAGPEQSVVVIQAAALLTAVAEELISQLNIFPNPVNKWLQIEGLPVDSQITICQSDGKVLIETSLNSHNLLVLPELPAGMYIVRITTGTFSTSKKIVKIHP